MANEIKPNIWYNLGQFFGDKPVERNFELHEGNPLSSGVPFETIDRQFRDIARMYGVDLEEREREIMKNLSIDSFFDAKFRGSYFILDLFRSADLTEDLTADADTGRKAYFPLEEPNRNNTKLFRDGNKAHRSLDGYAGLDFSIFLPSENDTRGEEFMHESLDHNEPVRAKPYNFRLLIKSDKGIWVSDAPLQPNAFRAYRVELIGNDLIVPQEPQPHDYHDIRFNVWIPDGGWEPGSLYVPEDKGKLSKLEIMLQEKHL